MNIADLNDGKLTLNLVAKTNDNQISASHKLEVATFKQPSAELKGLFKTEDQTSNDYRLDVMSNISMEGVFTVEELNAKVAPTPPRLEEERANVVKEANQPSTLTNLFKKTLITNEAANMLNKDSLRIEGNVKLEKITKEEDDSKTYFYLTSADNSFLKLSGKVMTEQSATSQIAVKEVRINNLAVSSISVIPVGNNDEASKEFTETLKETWKMTDPDGDGSSTRVDALTVTVPMTGREGAVTVNATAYTISKTSAEDTDPIKASLLVSFGSGTSEKHMIQVFKRS